MSGWQTDIMVEIIFISLHFIIFLASFYLLGKRISQPAVLFAFIWFLIIAAHLVFKAAVLERMTTPSVETYLIFLIGNMTFSFGSILVNQYHVPKFLTVQVAPAPQEPINASLRIFFTLFLLAALPFYIKKAFDIFIASQLDEFFIGLKHEISYGEASFGAFAYLVQLSYVVLGINFHAWYSKKSKRNLSILLCSLSLTLVYAIFFSGRLNLFMILCIYFGITFFSGQKIPLRKIAMPAFFFFLLFFIAGVVYKKGGDIDNSFTENLRLGTQSLGLYLVVPLDGIDFDLAHHVSQKTEGERTLRFFIKVAKATGIAPNFKPRRIVQEFVFTPYPTNVYTFYSSYIWDFGKIYAWLMLFIYSIVHTYLYNVSLLTRKLRTILYYSFLLFPLMLSFFDDMYVTLFSFWLQIFLFTEMILFADKILKAKEKNQYQ
jgi:oligosaccharide repeat unit polymerase